MSLFRDDVKNETAIELPETFAQSQSLNTNGEKAPQSHPAQEFMGTWWKVFQDPLLEEYLSKVIEQNLDFQKALFQIKQMEHLYGVKVADMMPSVNLGVDLTRTRNDITSPEIQSSPQGVQFVEKDKTVYETLSQFSLNLGYEIDLFGRVNSEAKAAAENYRAAIYQAMSLCQSIIVTAVNTYFQSIESAAQVDLSAKNIALSQNFLKLIEKRYSLGQSNVLDVNQARDNVLSAKSMQPVYEESFERVKAQMSTLAGKPTQLFKQKTSNSFPNETVELAIEAPVQVVQTRADVLASLRRVHQADSEAAAALASRFPRLSFTARVGFSAETLEEVFDPQKFFWQLIGNLSAPLFVGGKLRALHQSKETLLAERVLDYKKTVLGALSEVELGIKSLSLVRKRKSLTQAVVNNSKLTFKLAVEKYRQGLSPFLNVLTSRQALFQAERNLLSIQKDELAALVSLIHATGGMWLPGEVIAKAKTQGVELEEESK